MAALVAGCKSGEGTTDTNTNNSSLRTIAPETITKYFIRKGKTQALCAEVRHDRTRSYARCARRVLLYVTRPLHVANTPHNFKKPTQQAQFVVLADKILVTMRSQSAVVPTDNASETNDDLDGALERILNRATEGTSKDKARDGEARSGRQRLSAY